MPRCEEVYEETLSLDEIDFEDFCVKLEIRKKIANETNRPINVKDLSK
jgi:hypothetical protein